MKLLIADDDDYTREGLVDTLEWHRFGIVDVVQARDGAEALRIASTQKPDIVLTDIRMPKLNGIEFAEKLTESCPESKLLFMSGYMDIDYLKSAIRLSAVDYIEKPIKLAEVEKAIEKTIGQIMSSKKMAETRDRKIALERNRLAGMLRRGEGDRQELLSLCSETAFPANAVYIAMIVRVDNRQSCSEEWLACATDYWHRHSIRAIGEQGESNTFFLTLAFVKTESKRTKYLLDAFVEKNPQIVVGIGESADNLNRLPNSFYTASLALERFFYDPDRRAFYFSENVMNTADSHGDIFPEFYNLLHRRPDELKAWITNILERLAAAGTRGRDKVIADFIVIARAILDTHPALRVFLAADYGIANAEQRLRECRSLKEIAELMSRICEIFAMELQRSNNHSRLVQNVKQYVALHYRKVDLDLREIADHMHLSTAHLGMLFKQETGITIKQYISDYRMELAKKLVLNGHNKMNAIAELCGYASASYFTKVFKAATQQSPIEYRKQNEG